MILVKIYLYFAADSFSRRREILTSCVETKSKGEKVVICLQGKELLEKPCTSSCSILCVLQMGLKYRDIQGEWTIGFRCNENNHALCWGWQIRLSTLDNRHRPQPSASGNRACLVLTIWSITPNTGHNFYNILRDWEGWLYRYVVINNMLHFCFLKSVQSTLSHLQSPPDWTNAVPPQLWLLMAWSYWQCLPKIAHKVKDNALLEQFDISRSSIWKGGSNCDIFEITWQLSVNIESSFTLKEKKAFHSH